MTGNELKVLRVAAKVKAYDIAAAMGVHSSRISQIEALADVTPETAQRYTEALQSLAATSHDVAAVQPTGAA